MAIEITSTNFSGQTGEVTLYLPTGHTIPYNSPSGTTLNLGLQLIPFIYEAPNISLEYGVYSIFFSATSKTCLVEELTPPDGDGNVYRTIKIGNQIWMSENLRTTKFQDGSPIYYATSGGSWTTSASTTPLYTFVENNSGNTQIQGLLYNHQAVRFSTSANTTTNICPVGWRVPTQTDFNTLPSWSGTSSNDGSWLLYPGDEYWDYWSGTTQFPQTTNKSGFSLLGSGAFGGSSWSSFRVESYYRGTTSGNVGYRAFFYGVTVYGAGSMPSGASVRCIKN